MSRNGTDPRETLHAVSSGRRNTKQDLLHAAGRVILRDGVPGLTLDAVAAEAGRSKGGLIYHYPSKDALIGAMLDRLVEITEAEIAAYRARDDGPGSWTRGYLRACMLLERDESGHQSRLEMALLAACLNEPVLLRRLHGHMRDWAESCADDGIDPEIAHVVRLAADGLWMNDVFGLPVLEAEDRARVLRKLEALTYTARGEAE